MGLTLAIISASVCDGIFVTETKNGTSGNRRRAQQKLSPAEWTESGDADDGLWSSILEDWTLRYVRSQNKYFFNYFPSPGFRGCGNGFYMIQG